MVYMSMRYVGMTAIGFPLFGFLFAITWSILYDWESSCRTLCGRGIRPKNNLPTVSSAIGGYIPQRYVWRMCIMLQAGLRFMLAFGYYHWHLRIHMASYHRLYKNLVKLAVTCHILENLGLITLSSVSSTENADIHEFSFILFMAGSQIYMLLTCILLQWTHKSGHLKPSQMDSTLFKLKTFLFVFNFVVFMVAVYLYLRHNNYCEDYIYSWFAFFEYLTILSNIGFHGLCCIDFKDYSFSFLQTEDIRTGLFKNR